MIKKLTKHGNSAALIIDKAVLELLKIDMNTPLDISADEGVLMVSPVRDEERRRKLQEAVEDIDRRFGRALKRLAG
jgi:antitoxin component of MazEF toxin-antitoxin module